MSTFYEIELDEHFDAFVKEQVASGRYRDANDVFYDALRMLENRIERDREKLELLKSLAEEGTRQLDQGQGIEFRDREELRAILRGPKPNATQINRTA